MKPTLYSFALLAALAAAARALTPAELDANERDLYNTITQDNPAAAEDFLATRDYVHAILNPNVSATALPRMPDAFSTKYLLPNEDKLIRTAAVDRTTNMVAPLFK